MASENNVQRASWLAVAGTTVLFRINTGQAWVSGGGKPQRRTDGSVLVPFGRPIALGFANVHGKTVVGTPDLGGYTEMTVTPEMVGKKIAVVTFIETKKTKGGEHSDEQILFVNNIAQAGGIAGFANSPEAAKKIISDYFDYMKGVINLSNA